MSPHMETSEMTGLYYRTLFGKRSMHAGQELD